ncbi:SPOR domain-containing protein [Glycocaulis abyssi]|uniref:SPOR domain-containing protein n=1 Tax=Glycocaulis abyssi TaxID=1433403 RepID=A0ABV9N6Z4_9PROT
MIRLALPIFGALVLGACSVTGGHAGRDASPDAQQALRLAATLNAAARVNDPVLAHVTGEMDALEAALARGVPPAEEPPAEADEASLGLVPAPDAGEGQGLLSLLHGIHLASYREERHVAEGWRAMQGQHASLSGLQARYVPADLGERGIYLRLLAGPFDSAAEAASACRVIQAAQSWCAVTAFDGTPILSSQ